MLAPPLSVRKTRILIPPADAGIAVNSETIDVDAELRRLEGKIDALTTYCERLREENRSLAARYAEWSKERAQLIEKTAIAKNRLEAMIARLKSMGHET